MALIGLGYLFTVGYISGVYLYKLWVKYPAPTWALAIFLVIVTPAVINCILVIMLILAIIEQLFFPEWWTWVSLVSGIITIFLHEKS